MSCWTKAASACILASVVGALAVSSATFCLISGEGSRRPWARSDSHLAISVQLTKPFFCESPGGIRERSIWPAMPFQGGMSSSARMALTSETTHCACVGEEEEAFASGKFIQVALYSQPPGRLSVKRASRVGSDDWKSHGSCKM